MLISRNYLHVVTGVPVAWKRSNRTAATKPQSRITNTAQVAQRGGVQPRSVSPFAR
jgi:hypothetical protein